MSGEPRGTVAVVGAGLAGLTAAYRLQQSGFGVSVFEARDRVGGRAWAVRKGDYIMDLGAAFYLGTYRESIDLIHEVGLGPLFTEVPVWGVMPNWTSRVQFASDLDRISGLNGALVSGQEAANRIVNSVLTPRPRAVLVGGRSS
jgi:monoamine oxidase